MESEKLNEYIKLALSGDSKALETVVIEIQDAVFNLSLRMLGTVQDAEDAAQDILIRVMTRLYSYQGKAAFKTWVYRIASNYLMDYKKNMFSKYPLDFEYYSNDIKFGCAEDAEKIIEEMERDKLAEELKMSCTNVMLQCLDSENRLIFILGTMFRIDSKTAGEILGLSSANYRQKLSRSRKKMKEFLSEHCGLTDTGFCRCRNRVDYAIQKHRLNPQKLEYKNLKILDGDMLTEYKDSMEDLDDLSGVFENLPHYQSNMDSETFLRKLLQSEPMKKIQHF